MSAKRSDLEEAGIKTPQGQAGDMVSLAALGRPYQYDEVKQSIDFTLGDDDRLARIYNARGSPTHAKPQVDPGFLLNYSLFAGSLSANNFSNWQFRGENASLDARIFSQFGVFSQTAIVGKSLYRSSANFLRLDSTYTYTHADTQISYRAGDLISNGLAWTRPIRMGGVQVQRDFTLRPDLITRPLPTVSGTAAVPSTVDVYVNGAKSYSQAVAAGPYNIVDLPSSGTSGQARAIITDATGRQTETSVSFASDAHLLRPGLLDFSVETGVARRNYASRSDDYDKKPIGSATLRGGVTSWATLEGHAEGGGGLANGGAGAVLGTSYLGVFSFAGAASHAQNQLGWQTYGGWQGQFPWFSVNVGFQRASRGYQDLASITAPPATTIGGGLSLGSAAYYALGTSKNSRPPRALDSFSIGGPLPFDNDSSLNVSFIHQREYDGARQQIVTASLSRKTPIYERGTIFISAFADLRNKNQRGVYAGLSMPLGKDIQVAAGYTWDPVSHGGPSVQAQKAQPLQDNSYGWRLYDQQGKNAFRTASASYRSAFGQASAQVQQYGNNLSGSGQFDGSVAVMGGGVFFGNRVDTSFAVVNAGRPNIPVTQDNRVVGRTDGSGRMLVTNLRPYEDNRIGIDSSELPPDQDIGATSQIVAPMLKSGILVDFGTELTAGNAVVILVDANGKPLDAGHKAHFEDGKESFLVGYDGRAYITGLKAQNRLLVDLGDHDCIAEFEFHPQSGTQTLIRNVVCR